MTKLHRTPYHSIGAAPLNVKHQSNGRGITSRSDRADRSDESAAFQWLGTLAMFILFWLLAESVLANASTPAASPNAQVEESSSDFSGYSALWLRAVETEYADDSEGKASDKDDPYAALTLSTDVTINVSGAIVRTKVQQRYKNPSKLWMEGLYTFPLPENAAVDALRMKIGERIVDGVVKEKAEAKKLYTKAKQHGQRASLLSNRRANRFTTKVANIAPGKEITIEFEYQQILEYQHDRYTLRFPMVSTPAYTPPEKLFESGYVLPINSVKASDEAPGNPVAITVSINAGVPIEKPESESHYIQSSRISQEQVEVTLNGDAKASNRDFLLSWELQDNQKPQISVFSEEYQGKHYGVVMMMPPQQDFAEQYDQPRELVLVMDVSGSMQGESIRQARTAIQFALDSLQSDDLFNLVWFNDRTQTLFATSQLASQRNKRHAKKQVDALSAGGGTEMLPALRRALANDLYVAANADDNEKANEDSNEDFSEGNEILKQVIFVTDGAVSNEEQLFSEIDRRLKSTRLFTVGIGSAPNSFFMRKAADAGRGTFTYINKPEHVAKKMRSLLAQLQTPVLTNIQLDFQGYDTDVLPDPAPDLYLGEPLMLSFRAEELPEYLTIEGDLNGTASWLKVKLKTAQEYQQDKHQGLAKEWARRKIERLAQDFREVEGDAREQIKGNIIGLALEHQLVTRFTSLVAIDKERVRAGEQLNRERIKANRPKGWVPNHTNHSSNNGSSPSTPIQFAQTASGWPVNVLIAFVLLFVAYWMNGLTRRLK